MHLVFVASEAVPYAKTGGLADVAGALPLALAKLGHEVTIILPCYRRCRPFIRLPSFRASIEVPIGGRKVVATVKEANPPGPGVRVFLIDQPTYFERAGFYVDEHGADYSDNCERFAFLSRAALATIESFHIPVDVLHAHDWHSALAPIYAKTLTHEYPRMRGVGCVFTIHNIAFQGLFGQDKWGALGLDRSLFNVEGLEYYGLINLMKGAIVFSDLTTTVSRNYAHEIQGQEFGAGLENVLRSRRDRLIGIVNGIDNDAWNPETDNKIAARFSKSDWQTGKSACKADLRREMGLADLGSTPIFGLVGRLTDQKGLDLLTQILPELLDWNIQLAILGSGDARYEGFLARMAERHPEKLAVRLEFNEELARKIYAGSDMFLMPSRFEPCGLSQLYSLRFGTAPVVRAVGGLVDTVEDATPASMAAGNATGFYFTRYTTEALLSAMRRAIKVYETPDQWSKIVERGMGEDWSWEKSARQYVDIYDRALAAARAGSA